MSTEWNGFVMMIGRKPWRYLVDTGAGGSLDRLLLRTMERMGARAEIEYRRQDASVVVHFAVPGRFPWSVSGSRRAACFVDALDQAWAVTNPRPKGLPGEDPSPPDRRAEHMTAIVLHLSDLGYREVNGQPLTDEGALRLIARMSRHAGEREVEIARLQALARDLKDQAGNDRRTIHAFHKRLSEARRTAAAWFEELERSNATVADIPPTAEPTPTPKANQ